jgi:hypothetical protein
MSVSVGEAVVDQVPYNDLSFSTESDGERIVLLEGRGDCFAADIIWNIF